MSEFEPSFEPNMEQPEIDTTSIEVPESECRIQMSRGGGAGGQKRNKTSNRIQLWWNPDTSSAFTADQKEKIKERCANRINKQGEIQITYEGERSLEQNKSEARSILNDLVSQALTPEKERLLTKPTRSSKERRLKGKDIQSRKKAQRGGWKNFD